LHLVKLESLNAKGWERRERKELSLTRPPWRSDQGCKEVVQSSQQWVSLDLHRLYLTCQYLKIWLFLISIWISNFSWKIRRSVLAVT
jgi:hypothetical protein